MLPCSRNAERIRDLNDAFRRTFCGGRVLVTAGVAALEDEDKATVLGLVRAFKAFGPDNDPRGEHDFGIIEHAGASYMWKIDLYEEPDVKDANGEAVVTRVLTLMLAEDY